MTVQTNLFSVVIETVGIILTFQMTLKKDGDSRFTPVPS